MYTREGPTCKPPPIYREWFLWRAREATLGQKHFPGCARTHRRKYLKSRLKSGNEIRGPHFSLLLREVGFSMAKNRPLTLPFCLYRVAIARCAACREAPQLSQNHLFLPLRRDTPTCDPSHCLPASTAAEFTSSPGRHPS